MARQNIYDNDVFFSGYSEIRQREYNANNLFETPTLFALPDDVRGKAILDLGCGCGDHCVSFAALGADRVVGVDISSKMLAAAEAENSLPGITYINMAIEDIGRLSDSFDLVVSSLALHYVEDFVGVCGNVFSLLKPDGLFVFSQEHPLSTCFSRGSRWTKDEQGRKLFANIADYSIDGERQSTWFVDGVQKYHRSFSSIINTLIESGFAVERLSEPVPDVETMKEHPEFADLSHKPDFLVVRARKPKV